ncbi:MULTISPECIES: ribosome maturation factor RimM [Pseudomonas]|uniref:ribosome maturation factor RimM n=1 Tax=Pseudomonas TaxID=286 RepID=UPI00123C710F|nr:MULTISPECIES: ribosome maturation factor RimM [Pseudomonas]QIB51055.1 ribosome maturation factor RimM [Pseudomonas sp. OIL-1]
MTSVPESAESPLVVLGKIVGAHGIRGAVKVYSHTDPLDNILDYPRWTLRKGADKRTVTFTDARLQGRVLVVQLKGLDNRNQALDLTDFEICVVQSALPDLDEGEFYWHQLEGLQVVNLEGQLLGRVDHLLETGSNDVFVVKPCEGSLDQRERLLPYLPDQYVKDINLSTGIVQVDWDPEF